MANTRNDFTLDYDYRPSPEAEEQLTEAWEIIFALILQDIQNEQQGGNNAESESC